MRSLKLFGLVCLLSCALYKELPQGSSLEVEKLGAVLVVKEYTRTKLYYKEAISWRMKPQLSPDGTRLLYDSQETHTRYLRSLSDGALLWKFEGDGAFGRFAQGGKLVFLDKILDSNGVSQRTIEVLEVVTGEVIRSLSLPLEVPMIFTGQEQFVFVDEETAITRVDPYTASATTGKTRGAFALIEGSLLLTDLASTSFSEPSGRVIDGIGNVLIEAGPARWGEARTAAYDRVLLMLSGDYQPAGRMGNDYWVSEAAHIWDTQTKKKLFSREGLWSADLHPSGSKVVLSPREESVVVWDLITNSEVLSLPIKGASWVRYAARGEVILTRNVEGQLQWWEAKTGVEITKQGRPPLFAYQMTLSEDGEFLLAKHSSGAEIWSTQTGAFITKVADHSMVSFFAGGFLLGDGLGGLSVWRASR